MTNPENVGQQFEHLFHGTDATFASGDLVTPQAVSKDGEKGYGYAFATPDREYAAEHGKNVYEVEGLGDEYVHPDNEDAVVSRTGFRVK
jgi:hypothetical protein